MAKKSVSAGCLIIVHRIANCWYGAIVTDEGVF